MCKPPSFILYWHQWNKYLLCELRTSVEHWLTFAVAHVSLAYWAYFNALLLSLFLPFRWLLQTSPSLPPFVGSFNKSLSCYVFIKLLRRRILFALSLWSSLSLSNGKFQWFSFSLELLHTIGRIPYTELNASWKQIANKIIKRYQLINVCNDSVSSKPECFIDH